MSILEDAAHSKATPVYMTSRGVIIDYFQDTRVGRDKRGNEVWKPYAAAAIAGTSDKKSTAYKSAMRQFQMDKRTGQERYKSAKQTAATIARYVAVGQTLPPIHYNPKGNSVTITVSGTQKGSSHKNKEGKRHYTGTREREFTATLTGDQAYKFVNNPSIRDVLEALGYPDDVIDGLDEDGDYGLDITSAA